MHSDETIQSEMRQVRGPRSTVESFCISGYVRSFIIENPAFLNNCLHHKKWMCSAQKAWIRKGQRDMCWASSGDSFICARDLVHLNLAVANQKCYTILHLLIVAIINNRLHDTIWEYIGNKGRKTLEELICVVSMHTYHNHNHNWTEAQPQPVNFKRYQQMEDV